ncbi:MULTISPECIES: hypothetical protein [Paenibacillus]|uniref:Uncharacterized protein n=1 Tax=Paenibacillus albilobatus TaxID=2716884 RepID=A0A919XF11_9BACL|nr:MULTISPECIES: hypothetical protein [Paenibacillus]MDR9854750.1 hypothetical protein [Paenibacillus sp. VCA1]GIO29775.1 hypothetical protein J2TS6_09160 [Paenibacillus albilobatus]
MSILIVLLLICNLAVLLNINHKLPKRDYAREALDRDRQRKAEKEDQHRYPE